MNWNSILWIIWVVMTFSLQLSSTTVELSQALRERLKERQDSIGVLPSRRRCCGMNVSPLARSSRTSSMQTAPPFGPIFGSVTPQTSVGTTVTTTAPTSIMMTTTATSPSMPAVPISPTFNTSSVPVLVTASSFSSSRASPSSPRLSPVHGVSFNLSGSHPASPEGRFTPISATVSMTASVEELKSQATGTAEGAVELPLATLGVTRPRRRSRPSASPERGPPGGSPSHSRRRLPRLRRQSTTLDEGIHTVSNSYSNLTTNLATN